MDSDHQISYQSLNLDETSNSGAENASTAVKFIYESIKMPYDYSKGSHHLVEFVKKRMKNEDLIRICKSLAQFRPSFMALMMNLCKEDLIFMEKCFQRSLLVRLFSLDTYLIS